VIALPDSGSKKVRNQGFRRSALWKSMLQNSEVFPKSPWGRFGEEVLKIGENGFCYSINKFDYF